MNQRDTVHVVIVIIIAHWWRDAQTKVMQMNSTTIALVAALCHCGKDAVVPRHG